MSKEIIPIERVVQSIRWIRGQKVLLDSDLAALYGAPTGHLNRAVKRNASRFPPDFMFQLKSEELANLKCQIGISTWGGRLLGIGFVISFRVSLLAIAGCYRSLQPETI